MCIPEMITLHNRDFIFYFELHACTILVSFLIKNIHQAEYSEREKVLFTISSIIRLFSLYSGGCKK